MLGSHNSARADAGADCPYQREVEPVGEEWRPVEGWPYEVSNLGRVRRGACTRMPRRTHAGRLLSGSVGNHGYMRFTLTDGSRRLFALAHQLVARAFLGAPPTSGHEVAHGDGCRTNNVVSNLRWARHIENCADTIRHGRTPRGARNGQAGTKSIRNKLSEQRVIAIRREYARGDGSHRELAKRHGISKSQVGAIVTSQNWRWLEDAA